MKIKFRDLGIRVVYKVQRVEEVMKIIVISARTDEQVYREAAKRRDKQDFKDRMDKVLPREESDRAWQDAHSRLVKMYAAYPNLSKGVRAHTDSYIFPAAAIYLAIKVVSPEKAFEIMRDVMKENTEKIGRMLGKMMKIPGFKRFFLKMWDTMSHKNFGSTAGFCNVFYPKEKKRFKMDITACPYHKYLTELGCPEINILFCDNDVYAYGNLPGMKFIRTKTLGAGDELCDFCMEMEEKHL